MIGCADHCVYIAIGTMFAIWVGVGMVGCNLVGFRWWLCHKIFLDFDASYGVDFFFGSALCVLLCHALRGNAWESLGISTLIPIKEYYKHMGS